ncbi:MAG: hypothetical protein K8I82_12145 [Anaerolineae bacterium]|nr:hypothetical protein [Anaerolineae bacterium]
MGLKSRYILPGIFVIVVVSLLIANGRPQPLTTASPSSYYYLFPFSPQEVTGIELWIPEQEFDLVVTLDENKEWRILSEEFPQVNPAGPELASQLLSQMVGVQQIERGERSMEEFGFLPFPKYVVRFQLSRVISGQNRFMFAIGDKTPQGNAYYVAGNPESNIIDIVPMELIDNLVGIMTSLEEMPVP